MSNPDVPVLRRSASVHRSDDRVAIDHLSERVQLDGAAARLFRAIEPHIDGKRSVGNIAALSGEMPERVRTLLERLSQTGVLTWVGGDPGTFRMTGVEFHAYHRRYVREWLRPIYAHPLWDEITSGQASRAQVLGYAFEKYHYIEGAHEHMGVAAANATPELMPHLARHFVEEYTHGDIYRRGLRSLYSDEVILASQPLPSTRALINFLTESAARSSFAYYAGNELLQTTENTSDVAASGAIDSFHDAMKRHYPWSEKLVDAFVAHTRADQKLGHEDVFLQMCNAVPALSRAEVADAMETTRLMAEHLALFLDGIRTHYRAFPTVPRLPCTLLSE